MSTAALTRGSTAHTWLSRWCCGRGGHARREVTGGRVGVHTPPAWPPPACAHKASASPEATSSAPSALGCFGWAGSVRGWVQAARPQIALLAGGGQNRQRRRAGDALRRREGLGPGASCAQPRTLGVRHLHKPHVLERWGGGRSADDVVACSGSGRCGDSGRSLPLWRRRRGHLRQPAASQSASPFGTATVLLAMSAHSSTPSSRPSGVNSAAPAAQAAGGWLWWPPRCTAHGAGRTRTGKARECVHPNPPLL